MKFPTFLYLWVLSVLLDQDPAGPDPQHCLRIQYILTSHGCKSLSLSFPLCCWSCQRSLFSSIFSNLTHFCFSGYKFSFFKTQFRLLVSCLKLPFSLHGEPCSAVRCKGGFEASLPAEPFVVEGGNIGHT